MRKLLRRIRRIIRFCLKKDFFTKPDIAVTQKFFGTAYGGWNVATTAIDKNSVVYSFGIGEDASFDSALIAEYNLTVHGFDPTPKSIDWIKKQPLSENFILHTYGLAQFDGELTFHPPKNENHVSHSIFNQSSSNTNTINVPVKTLSTILKILNHDRIDILKMDIEGAEYEVLKNILDSPIRPRQILIEFHHRFPAVGIKQSKEAISALKDADYSIFAVSSSGEEYCFIYTPKIGEDS